MRYFQRDLFFYFARHRRHHSRFAGKIECLSIETKKRAVDHSARHFVSEGRTLSRPAPRTARRFVRPFASPASPYEFSETAFRKIDNEIWDLRVAVLGKERAAIRTPEDGKRSPVEIY
jgi:hypothetical protein